MCFPMGDSNNNALFGLLDNVIVFQFWGWSLNKGTKTIYGNSGVGLSKKTIYDNSGVGLTTKGQKERESLWLRW